MIQKILINAPKNPKKANGKAAHSPILKINKESVNINTAQMDQSDYNFILMSPNE